MRLREALLTPPWHAAYVCPACQGAFRVAERVPLPVKWYQWRPFSGPFKCPLCHVDLVESESAQKTRKRFERIEALFAGAGLCFVICLPGFDFAPKLPVWFGFVWGFMMLSLGFLGDVWIDRRLSKNSTRYAQAPDPS